MRTISLAALAFAASLPTAALAQDDAAPAPRTFEPYVGVLGGLHDFDNGPYKGGPPSGYRGWLVEGVAGVNVNLGRLVVGGEGSVAKGVDKDIDWEYGAAGRLGVRVGKDSLFFGKVGYQWTQFNDSARPPVPTNIAYDGVTYGGGVEVSAADLGLGDSNRFRLRGQVDTRGNFHSFRPMVGVVARF